MWGTTKNWPRQRQSPGSLLLLNREILGIRIYFFPCRYAGSSNVQPIALWGSCSHWLLGLKLQRRESLDFLGTSFIPVSLSPAADSAGSAPEPRLGMQWLPPLLSSWHPCMAYGTPAWHMAALLSSWHICTMLAHLHGAGTCAWHLPPLPSPWQDPAATTVTGREEGAVPFSPDPPAGPCLALSPAQAHTSFLSPALCHFWVRIT